MSISFQSFWYGPELSPIESLCLLSFVKQGMEFDLYTYVSDLEVPEGVTLRDAGEIYDEDEVFRYQEGPGEGSVAAFANMFRYKLLYERGGWWVDTDIVYTGHRLPEQSTFFGWQNESDICNAIMRAEPGNPVVRECLETAEELRADVSWGEAGPKLLTDVIRRQDKNNKTFPEEYAYPLSWNEGPSVYQPSEAETVQSKINSTEAPFLHLWNEILRRTGIQKTIAPPKGSYLSTIANEIGADWPNDSVRYSAEAIERMCENYRVAREAEWQLNRIKDSTSWKLLKLLRLDFSG